MMMDSYELTKIAGAVLAALMLIVAPRTAIHLVHEGHEGPVVDGYKLPEASAAATSAAGAPAPAAFDPQQVVAKIATANAENGAATFKKCLGCHTDDKAAASKAGPNLWGVIGRARAARTDFPGYSEAMKSKGGEWTYADLAAFIHSPKTFLPGTKMGFAGVPDAGDIADLLAYVRTLADTPAALP